MGVHFLTQDNFQLQNGGQKMVCDVDGVCIVMFKSEKDPGSKMFWPYFAKIANRDQRLTFAALNVETNRKIVQMSKSTKTPLVKVPYFVLYVSGRPYSVYKGKADPNAFMSFLDKMVQKILQTEAPTSSMNTGVGREMMTTNVPIANTSASFGGGMGNDPIDKEVGRPTLPDGVTKIPHNKAWLADVKARH